MATVGPTFAGTGANSNDGGTTAWSNPTNAQGDTTSTAATCSPGSSIGNTSQRLRLSNFGLSVPTGATVLGITVEIEKQASANNRSKWGTNGCQLLKAGAETGSDLGAGAVWSNSKAIQTLGDAANLWGTTWTPAEVSASGFGVSIKTERTSASAVTDSVFRARITITFTPPNANGSFVATGGGVEATGASKGGQVSVTATGGGVLTWDYAVASTENHDGAIVATGGGIAAVGSTADHSAAFAATGGGVETTSAAGGRSGSFAAVGAGVGAVGVSTDRPADLQATGGGVISPSVLAGRQLAFALSGGGVIATDQSTERFGALTATGGGTAGVTGTQGESHDGTFAATGGGALAVEALAERLASIVATGSGVWGLGASSDRLGWLSATGGGRATVTSTAPIPDLPDLIVEASSVGLTVSTSHVDLEVIP